MTSNTTAGPAGPAAGSRIPWFQLAGLALAAGGFALPYLVSFEGLSPGGHRMLGIFLMAVALWVFEVIPMHATATLIILLEVLLLSQQAPAFLMGAIEPAARIDYRILFATLADPVIILFLGGFFLADCAGKYRLDRNLSRVMLRPFGTHPYMVLMGLMVITAGFSMFMSNTATTATMMAVAIPVMAQFPPGDRLRAAIAISIPFAANIGGIGTPIGTPPNAIVLGALGAEGHPIPSFVRWMSGAVPFVVVFLALGWGLLIVLFRSGQRRVQLELGGSFDTSGRAIIFYIVFAATVALWMTEGLHGINSNIVAFIPVTVLLSTRIFTVQDLQNLDWHVLWLVAGGIALGTGIAHTGMARWFIDLFPWGRMSPFILLAVLSGVALVTSTFISNSATAALLVPIGIAMALTNPAISPTGAGVFIAIGTSLAMALPISTPPNAVAFATGEVKVRDMALVGVLLGAGAYAIFILLGPMVWRGLGIIQ
jgi:solute carrier family 13 (sodium-dependent dicarboxylate transporter), member 2/3/5